jgi:uncharacterized protein (TIGR02284 family)
MHMSSADNTVISTLNSLIETCNDGAQGFRTAAQELKDATAKALFNDYARQRDLFVEQLREEVRRLGGTPEEGGSVSGAMHRGWMNIKSAIAGKSDSAIIAEAERGEDVAVATYQNAIQSGLPPQLLATVQRQLTEIKSAHDRVRGLEKTTAR